MGRKPRHNKGKGGGSKSAGPPKPPKPDMSAFKCKHLADVDAPTVLASLRGMDAEDLTDCQDCVDGYGPSGASEHDPEDPDAVSDETVWVCLTTGRRSCGRRSKNAHAVARGRRHPVVMSTTTTELWCYACDAEVEETPEYPPVLKIRERVMAVAYGSSGGGEGGPGGEELPAPEDDGGDDGDAPGLLPDGRLKPRSTVRGLQNMGNTCFFNSVLQNLLSLDPLMRHFVKAASPRWEGGVTAAFRAFVYQARFGPTPAGVTTGRKATKGTVTPRALLAEITKLAPRFKGFKQQDSQELLRYLVDSLEIEERRRLRKAEHRRAKHAARAAAALAPPVAATAPPAPPTAGAGAPSGEATATSGEVAADVEPAATEGASDAKPGAGEGGAAEGADGGPPPPPDLTKNVSYFFGEGASTCMTFEDKAPAVEDSEPRAPPPTSTLMPNLGLSTIVSDVFGGLLCSSVVCDVCHTTSITFDPCYDVSMPVPVDTSMHHGGGKKNKKRGGGGYSMPLPSQQPSGRLSKKQRKKQKDRETERQLALLRSSLSEDAKAKLRSRKGPGRGGGDEEEGEATEPTRRWLDGAKKRDIAGWILQNSPTAFLEERKWAGRTAQSAAKAHRKEELEDMAFAAWEAIEKSRAVKEEAAKKKGGDKAAKEADKVKEDAGEAGEGKEESKGEGDGDKAEEGGDVPAKPAEGEDSKPAEGEEKPAEAEADAKPQEADAKPEEADAKPAEAKEEATSGDSGKPGYAAMASKPPPAVATPPVLHDSPLAVEPATPMDAVPPGMTRVGSLLFPVPLPVGGVSGIPRHSLAGCLSVFTAPEQLRVSSGNGFRCATCAAQEAAAVPPAEVSAEGEGTAEGEAAAAEGAAGEGGEAAAGEGEDGAVESEEAAAGESAEAPPVEAEEPAAAAGAGAGVEEDSDDGGGWIEVGGPRRSRVSSAAEVDADEDVVPPPAVEAVPPPVPRPDEPATVLRDASKRILFYSPPTVLTLHLKRFAQTLRGSLLKVSTQIAFPTELDLTPYVARPDVSLAASRDLPPAPTRDRFMYRLTGIVVHSGGMGGGHYVAYVRLNGAWVYASDTTISATQEANVLKSQAYLLFYTLAAAPEDDPEETKATA